MSWLARAAYGALLRLATPLYLLRLLWRGRREPLYRAELGQRLGFGRADATGRLWLHAVSLGETRAASALIDELRRRRPHLRLLLTHGTATGREAGAALLHKGDAQAWLPYDTPGAVRRFLAAHRPAAGVIMETETWPNLLHGAARADVPLVLANARLSERSRRKGERLAWLMRPAAACLRVALAQTEDDAQRLRHAGVREVQVLGNLKFDIAPAAALLEVGRTWRAGLARPVVMLAVSRQGEELPLLEAWLRQAAASTAASTATPTTTSTANPHDARPLLLIVPRHPQRFDEVAAMVRARGLTLTRRSTWAADRAADRATDMGTDRGAEPGPTPPLEARDADVWLGDSMREMPLYYALADVALLGGSFEPLGGQNLIEAAACGCPLLMGPHTFNFAHAAELALAAGAAERVVDIETAVARALAWLQDPAALAARAQCAVGFAAQHRGAAQRMAAAVLTVMERGG